MVSGTVAQWECVWGQSYGDLRPLALVLYAAVRVYVRACPPDFHWK